MPNFQAEHFYDAIADKYNWFFSSREKITQNEKNIIHPILAAHNAKRVLDCSCGDGLQSIALAQLGYRVDGSDISSGMVQKAKEYAQAANLSVTFEQADFRELENVFSEEYDCVLSWGNSIPHLMNDGDIAKALGSMNRRVRKGGIAVFEMRNYDVLLAGQKRFLPMRIHDVQDGFRYSILYVLDYLPQVIRFNIVYLTENLETGEKRMEQESVDYNPIRKDDFLQHLDRAGFCNVKATENSRSICYIAEKR